MTVRWLVVLNSHARLRRWAWRSLGELAMQGSLSARRCGVRGLSSGLTLLLIGVTGPLIAAPRAPNFEREVAAVLLRRCVECHQGPTPSGGLNLTRADGLVKGGDSGAVVSATSPEASILLQRVSHGEMPPPLKGIPQRLPEPEIDVLQRWLAAGAVWPPGRVLDLYEQTNDRRGGRDWWSLQPIRRPAVPKLTTESGHPLDAFVGSRLQREGMTPSLRADRRTLIRRAYHDVLGLPPSADAVEAFIADESPVAWENLIDQLLASPLYGERWGRHWLDLVRFAETSGYERDQTKPFAWKYRDWVVASLNEDRPFHRMILEQLAGDELPDRSEQSLIATGFLRLGTWNDEPNDPDDYTYDRLEDVVHATSTAFFGLTVKCARCHDHKFDPIPQTDYYRLASAFWPGPLSARDRQFLGGPTPEEFGRSDILGWTDLSPTPAPLSMLKNGDRHRPIAVVEPAGLSFLPQQAELFIPPPAGSRTTQRRRQLAEWIIDRRNPLTPRVLVNRLWQHHFGHGLVRSVDNFGFTGDKPTHPELLDWLADEFVRHDWRWKPLHRLILTSETWRQSSLSPHEAAYRQRDAGNHFWWKAERRRLEAEALRDAMLFASGDVDLRLGGPSFKPTVNPEALEGLSRKAAAWEASSPAEQRRRSLYIFSQRSLLPPWMTAFDFSDTTLPCGQRDVTTVAPQALALLNNPFGHEQATALAARVLELSSDDRDRVHRVWRFAYSRSPDAEEVTAALAHVQRQRAQFVEDQERRAWASLCLVLLNANEFVYVD